MSQIILTSFEGQYGIEASIKKLNAGATTLDALEAGIQNVEMDFRARTVGYGGAPNALGEMEFDASIMHGSTKMLGSVGALQGFKYPISVARKVMETLPHVFLVGGGANRFATEMQLERFNMLAPESKDLYDSWLSKMVPANRRSDLSNEPLVPLMNWKARRDLSQGTVTFMILNNGELCGGVSTSGWAYKYPGRLGDSPVVGAGLYVDSKIGGASCTHTGEMTIRTGTARAVVAYMKRGATLEEACNEALNELKELKEGFIGPVIIHGMNAKGEIYVTSTGIHDGGQYYYWRSGDANFSEGQVVPG